MLWRHNSHVQIFNTSLCTCSEYYRLGVRCTAPADDLKYNRQVAWQSNSVTVFPFDNCVSSMADIPYLSNCPRTNRNLQESYGSLAPQRKQPHESTVVPSVTERDTCKKGCGRFLPGTDGRVCSRRLLLLQYGQAVLGEACHEASCRWRMLCQCG